MQRSHVVVRNSLGSHFHLLAVSGGIFKGVRLLARPVATRSYRVYVFNMFLIETGAG